MAAAVYSEWTDEALLGEYGKNRCDGAFTELHRRNNPRLQRLLKWWFRFDAYTVDEVCQTTWIRIAKLADKPIDCFRGWLCHIGRLSGKNWLQCRSRGQRKKEIRSQAEFADARTPLPLDELIAREEISAIGAALAKLEPPQRAILESFYLDDMMAREACGTPDDRTDRPLEIVKKAKRAFVRALSPEKRITRGKTSPKNTRSDWLLRKKKLARSPARSYCDEASRFIEAALGHEEGDTAQAIGRLDYRLQSVAAMHFIDGLSDREISSRLNIHRYTVVRRLQKAKTALGRLVDGTAPETMKMILDPQLQSVAAMHFRDGLSLREIARRLGITAATASKRLRKAKLAMQSSAATAA
ncbi:MAG TPA: sigma factor-like helix-turn-helix DNA-binding protein [Pirellulales bacterium]|jgi:DNA-directed RNA polymerase specialized sigma24 family protein|nr:sigma factor-like helix-turn-helix DNA-binding protein [Pirellulales bacterium]